MSFPLQKMAFYIKAPVLTHPIGIEFQKNKSYLLKVARALLFTTKVPNYLQGETILIVTFLINQMPSRVINFQTPVNIFKSCFVTSQLISDIPFKIFLLYCFSSHPWELLLELSVKMCFYWIFLKQKGYKCFEPISQKLFVTMDATFFETQMFFKSHLQGKIGK